LRYQILLIGKIKIVLPNFFSSKIMLFLVLRYLLIIFVIKSFYKVCYLEIIKLIED